MSATAHGACCFRVASRVGGHVEGHRLGAATVNDDGFDGGRGPDKVRGPDVAFWREERLADVPVGYTEIAPDLAVEVLEPSDNFTRINRKLHGYLEKGVSMVWIVDPEDRTVTVYRPGEKSRMLTEAETLDGADVLPGFSCKVADLFP